MTKAELRDLAEAGARQRVQQITKQLEGLRAEFPGIFATATLPVLLAPDLKPGGSDWPGIQATPPPDDEPAPVSKRAASWTPERRAKAARAIRKRMKAMHAARRAKKQKPKKHPASTASSNGAEPWGHFFWQRMHDYLATQPDYTASTADILKGAKGSVSPTMISAVKLHPELFKRTGLGIYALKKVITHGDVGVD